MSSLTESNKCVLILGAGFSAPYGLPVMNDFMDTARRKFFGQQTDGSHGAHIKACYEGMLEFEQSCYRSSRFFNRNWENLEELYTQADLLRLSSEPGDEEAKLLCAKIAWAIWDVYRPLHTEHFSLQPVLQGIKANRLEPIIITTNYDLVCEQGLFTYGSGYYYHGFNQLSSQVSGMLETADKNNCPLPESVPLIKLHGSVSWFNVPEVGWLADTNAWGPGDSNLGSLDFKPETLLYRVNRIRAVKGKHHLSTLNEFEPAIIPPMLGKASTSQVIAKQWKEAINAVRAARLIFIIGYSFPTTDAFMPRLLSEGLKHNGDIVRIMILNIDRFSQWKDRLEDLFAPPFRRAKVSYVTINSENALSRMANQSILDATQTLMQTVTC